MGERLPVCSARPLTLYREGNERLEQKKQWWQPFVILVALIVFLTVAFYADNKYQTPPPYGKSGVIEVNQNDFKRSNPIYLIDGWLLSDGTVTDQPTYIGEFSSLQRGDWLARPHGLARYLMVLRYTGTPEIVSVDFPQLASSYAISLDGTVLDRGKGNGHISFLLTEGDHLLEVRTQSRIGYYSGMYFPPALGLEQTLERVKSIQSFAYALAFLLPLALASFTIFLWRTGGRMSRWFGMLCCFYALYMFRYFVFLFGLAFVEYWFFVQSLAFYGICFSVVQLTAFVSGADGGRVWRWMRLVLFVWQVALLLLALLILVWPWTVFVHGRLTDFYYAVTFCTAVFFAVRRPSQGWEGRYTQAGCMVFGAGLMVNLFFSNQFEPIRFFWQFEWCGLLLVLLFAAMMVARSRRILRENDTLTNHLEEQVKLRTQEVAELLKERKAFFADMAHDLKAPVFATQSFIEAIRQSGVGVDMELREYLDRAEAKQREMARRLQGLSAINELDRIEGERVRISVKELLLDIDATYRGETEVRSVYLIVEPPERDAYLLAQQEKLDILFENLIYNALRATQSGGRIAVSARTGKKIWVTVEDNGCGIPKEELPLIFDRFYVGENNRETGTGLGLYIVHSIVSEMGGTISVQSVVGKGTRFLMEFPSDG